MRQNVCAVLTPFNLYLFFFSQSRRWRIDRLNREKHTREVVMREAGQGWLVAGVNCPFSPPRVLFMHK